MGHLTSTVKHLLAHPQTRHLDLDHPATTAQRRAIVRGKPFLRKVYDEWYRFIANAIPPGSNPVLELGSGAGFMRHRICNLITSDMLPCPDIDLVADGQTLPFADQSLRAIVMVDVFHHIPHVGRFLAQAARCVEHGGVIAMVEPWVTTWSRWVYTHLHHEPFRPDAVDWTFASTGPLSGANGALPWIVLERDRDRFDHRFPQWRISSIKPCMPLRYLLSGGVSMRSLQPGWSFGFWKALEQPLERFGRHTAMFAKIVLRRTGNDRTRPWVASTA